MNIIEKAEMLATIAHQAINQRRRYTQEPYINHPIAVMNIVKTVPHTDEMLAAALCHDVVEDTSVTLETIAKYLGPVVTQLVSELTNVSVFTDGNRETRKALDRAHTAKCSAEAATVKLADIIHNSESILKYDPKFAKIYMHEKRLLLEVLTHGDQSLHAIASKVVHGYFTTIAEQEQL